MGVGSLGTAGAVACFGPSDVSGLEKLIRRDLTVTPCDVLGRDASRCGLAI